MKKKHAWMIIILVVGLLFFLSSIPGLRVLPLVRQINHLLRSYDLSITRLSQWIAQRLPMHTNELRPLETISQDFYRYARANPVIIEFILRKLAHVFIFFHGHCFPFFYCFINMSIALIEQYFWLPLVQAFWR